MTRTAILIVMALGALLAACSPAAQPGGSGTPAGATGAGGGGGGTTAASQSPAGGGGGGGGGGAGGAGLADAAAKVTDWCALIPTDVVAKFAPGAPAPTTAGYPTECFASNGTGALDFRYSTGFGAFDTPSGAETVDGVGAAAYLDRPSQDEVELWVALQVDPEVYLFIDVAGHDGKDHKADAVALAQAVIAKLQ